MAPHDHRRAATVPWTSATAGPRRRQERDAARRRRRERHSSPSMVRRRAQPAARRCPVAPGGVEADGIEVGPEERPVPPLVPVPVPSCGPVRRHRDALVGRGAGEADTEHTAAADASPLVPPRLRARHEAAIVELGLDRVDGAVDADLGHGAGVADRLPLDPRGEGERRYQEGLGGETTGGAARRPRSTAPAAPGCVRTRPSASRRRRPRSGPEPAIDHRPTCAVAHQISSVGGASTWHASYRHQRPMRISPLVSRSARPAARHRARRTGRATLGPEPAGTGHDGCPGSRWPRPRRRRPSQPAWRLDDGAGGECGGEVRGDVLAGDELVADGPGTDTMRRTAPRPSA